MIHVDIIYIPELINGRLAYVSVSRASHDAQIFTNDRATLAETPSHDVSKASTVDFGKVQSSVASVGLEQTAALSKAPLRVLGEHSEAMHFFNELS